MRPQDSIPILNALLVKLKTPPAAVEDRLALVELICRAIINNRLEGLTATSIDDEELAAMQALISSLS